MRLHYTILMTIALSAVSLNSTSQVPTPPILNVTDNITIEVGGNTVSISAEGKREVIHVLNEWSNVPPITYLGNANHGDIVGFCPKPGVGNEGTYYALSRDGKIKIRKVTIVNSNIIVQNGHDIGKWNLAVNSTGFTKIAGDALYVLNNRILGKSNDNGVTWGYDTAGVVGSYLTDFALDTAQNVYATDGSRVYYQSAAATTWTIVSAFPAGVSPQSIYIDRMNRIWVGTNGHGVYHSLNAGTTWIPTSAGLGTFSYKRISDDRFGNLYVIEIGGTKLYRSTDVGLNWTRIDTPITNLYAASSGFNTIINDIKGDSILEVVSSLGRFFSHDQGNSWTIKNKGLSEISLTGFYKAANGRLIESSNTGVYYLNAADSVWHKVLPTDGYGRAGILLTDTLGNIYLNGLSVYSGAAIMKSTDQGMSWLPDTLGLYQIQSAPKYWVDERGNEHIANNNYSKGSTIYSKISGGSFVLDTMGIGIPDSAYDNTNAFGSDHNGYLYLAASYNHKPNIWRRPIAGGAWTPDTAGTGGTTFLAMTADRTHAMIGSPLYNHAGLFYRPNSGVWTAMPYPSGLSPTLNVTAIATDNSNGIIASFSEYDYVNSQTIGRGIYCTHDYGAHWTMLGLDSIYVNQLVNIGDSTYAITNEDGVYALTCNGVVGNPTTAVSELSKTEREWQLYPNPTTGLCHIILPATADGNGEVKIVDVTGRVVMSEPIEANTVRIDIQTGQLDKGIYYCTLQLNGSFAPFKKLVVE